MAHKKNKYRTPPKPVAAEEVTKESLDFAAMRVGKRTLVDDVVADFGHCVVRRRNNRMFKQEDVDRMLKECRIEELRELSNYFFRKSGIYQRLCRYLAYLYRFDWFITPIVQAKEIKSDKVVEGWYKASTLLENSNIKQTLGSITLDVIRNGCYYGMLIEKPDSVYIQELPCKYCRSRYIVNGNRVIEFNMRFFDECFADADYRKRVLQLFPIDIQKAYRDYKAGKLPKDFSGDINGWYLLDPAISIKFTLSDSDAPLFASVIPAIMDLEDAQELDKQKTAQQLLKIIIQHMPLDKNGDMIFDLTETQQLHRNAVAMLGDAIGVDVLTTFADVQVADMSDKGNTSSVDQLNKVERAVYNEAGVSQMQFNTDGNIALEKSIANDEATVWDLVLQYERLLNRMIRYYNRKPKKLRYHVSILPTTIYNYKELSGIFKEHTMLGFSKLLPQVALGLSQTEIIASVMFENEMLHLDELFVAPTLSSNQAATDDKGGRPEKASGDKTPQTLEKEEGAK